MRDADSERPEAVVREADGRPGLWQARYVAGCDGRHGAARRSLPAGTVRHHRDHGVTWLGLLAEAPPSLDAVGYAVHEHGFAGHMARTSEVTRYYLQCERGTPADAWSEERIWDELELRMRAREYGQLRRGRVVQRSVVNLESGRARTAAPGRAVPRRRRRRSDQPVRREGRPISRSWKRRSWPTPCDRRPHCQRTPRASTPDSARCLRHIWRAQEFSHWDESGCCTARPAWTASRCSTTPCAAPASPRYAHLAQPPGLVRRALRRRIAPHIPSLLPNSAPAYVRTRTSEPRNEDPPAMITTLSGDTSRLRATVDFVKEQDTATLLRLLLPGLDGPELRALAERCDFSHAALLVFPPDEAALSATLADCGLVADAPPRRRGCHRARAVLAGTSTSGVRRSSTSAFCAPWWSAWTGRGAGSRCSRWPVPAGVGPATRSPRTERGATARGRMSPSRSRRRVRDEPAVGERGARRRLVGREDEQRRV